MPLSPMGRAAKVMQPKYLKDAGVGFKDAKRGTHTLYEHYQKPSSPFHTGANAQRATTIHNGQASSHTTYQKAKLTKLGRRTTTGLALGSPIAYAAGKDYQESRRKNVAKSVWGVDHGSEEIAKMREPKQKTPVAQRSALHRPTAFNSRTTNAAKWSAGGAGSGAAYGSTFGRKGAAVGALAGAAAGGALGAAMPSKNHPNAANMRNSVQQGEDNVYRFKRAKYDAKKAGTWKSQKHAIQNDAMRREHKRVAQYYKNSGNHQSY